MMSLTLRARYKQHSPLSSNKQTHMDTDLLVETQEHTEPQAHKHKNWHGFRSLKNQTHTQAQMTLGAGQ